MIVAENISDTLVKHYSDAGLMMKQEETGAMYGEAIDVIPCRYTYTETDIPIDPEDAATEEDYQHELERLGVELSEEG